MLFVFSEGDKVPIDGLSIKEKDKEDEKEKKHGNGSSTVTASPTNQLAAVTQWVFALCLGV